MKCTMIIVLLGLVAVVAARPDTIVDLEDIHQEVDIDDDDTTITGSYSWTSPEGHKYFVKYIADENGYRIIESNAIPITANGVKADGTQGAFESSEEDDRNFSDFDDK